MRHRHWFLVATILSLAYFWASAVSRFYGVVGGYPDEQMRSATLLAITFTLVWLVLEVTARVLAARAPRCPCGYSLAGMTCPECGRTIGEASPRQR